VTDLEPDMQFVFSKIGKSEDAVYAERLIWYVTSAAVAYTKKPIASFTLTSRNSKILKASSPEP
jgi:hypothetical protein